MRETSKEEKLKKNTKKMIAKRSLKDAKEEKFRLEDEIVIGLNLVDDKNIKVTDKHKRQKQMKKLAKKQKAIEQKRKADGKKRKQMPIKAKPQKQAMSKTKKVPKKMPKQSAQRIQKTTRRLSPKEYIQREEKRKRMKKILVHIVQVLILFLILLGIFLFATLSPMFDLSEVIVENNTSISESTIMSLSRLELGENIFRFSKKEVVKNIKEEPYIDKVKVTRVLPDKVKIEVQERSPKFLIEYGAGYVYMNSQGYFLEISQEKLALPILIGWQTKSEEIVAGNRFCEEDLVRLGDVLKIVKAAETYQIYDKITRIDIQDDHNYILILEGEKKKIHLGTVANLDTKMPNIQMVLEKEAGVEGEYFLNVDLNKRDPYFREKV